MEHLINENVEKTDYTITFKKVGALNFSEIISKEGIEQKKKNFIEKLMKDILLSSKDRIRFGSDRMIISMDKNKKDINEIDDIMQRYDGNVEIVSSPENEFPVKYILKFNRSNIIESI